MSDQSASPGKSPRADRYSLFRVGRVSFAYSDFAGYVSALQDAWNAGFVPHSGPRAVPAGMVGDVSPPARVIDRTPLLALGAEL